MKLEETEIPKPKKGEMLIRSEVIGVNYTDIARRRNSTRERTPLPFTPGVEIVGRVVERGEDATSLPVGTRVIALLPRGGGYAEYVTVPAALLLPIPDGIDAVEAAALPVQGITAYQIVAALGRLKPGERIFIQAAAGGVGHMAVQLAGVLGAGQIIAGASSRTKLDFALSLGADAGINYSHSDWKDRLIEATEGKGVDLILDMQGGSAFSDHFALLAPLGRIVMFGAASGQRGVIDAEKLTSRCHSVTGYYAGFMGSRPDLFLPDWQALLRYVLAGQVKPQINHRFRLGEAAEAHRQIEARRTSGKVILLP
ncbi:quinone oxidoreductase family protein [Paenibacillus glycinis]|uniref:Zinc-binding dehydrogenase n=1 Tax=Paenibacillus glycinis TaxID=2697035 RepID=A0ABW9XI97_9BACL|nr:NADPH:quinone oxidoreductase family protein [Paenibacillus glycinis]NBD22310.1 zinc-binding dehydrogenase [Paenibacillus glycinis]